MKREEGEGKGGGFAWFFLWGGLLSTQTCVVKLKIEGGATDTCHVQHLRGGRGLSIGCLGGYLFSIFKVLKME